MQGTRRWFGLASLEADTILVSNVLLSDYTSGLALATKILLAVGVLVMLAAVLALTGRKSVSTELFIPASPEAVWVVLSDAAHFSEWNPVIVDVQGVYREGEQVTNRVIMDGSESTMTSRVVRVEPNRLLNQRGGPPGILTFDHTWKLEPVENGTLVRQREEYRGIGVWFWDASVMEPLYGQANEALRAHVLDQASSSR